MVPIVSDGTDTHSTVSIFLLFHFFQTTKEQKAALADCRTIIMNGPMGVFEFEKFNKGTFGLVNILADLTKEKGAITIIGGGDSVAATEQSGRAKDMSHISTGGGASLELLEGKALPGVVALDDK
jgi:phosphoglycerate kinase